MKAIFPPRNTKRIFFLVLLISILCIPLAAQEIDHVHLKTGSIVRGKIVEIVPEEHLQIEDLSGNLWQFNMSEVERISSEPFKFNKRMFGGSLGFHPGFVNMTSIGFLAGSSHNQQVAPFSLLTVNGYRTSKGLFAGVGTGVEFLSVNHMPFFLDLRYDLMGEDVVPYVVAKGGYSTPLSREDTNYDLQYEYFGGVLLGFGVGLKVKTRNHFAWDLSLMYRFQETSYKETYGWNNQTYEYTDKYNRIEIRLGFYID